MLKSEECQKIVNRVVNILGKHINIINLDGIVIASSNLKRIGTFHEGGKLCAVSGSEVIITEKNMHMYKGCKQGINLPIQYKNKTIGIVGITGKPEEIKGYGLLVKEVVELIVHENESRYAKELHEQALRSFIMELINGKGEIEEEIYINRAKLLGINDLRERTFIIGSMLKFADELKGFDEIKMRAVRQRIISFISNHFSGQDIIIFYLYDENFIIFLPSTIDIDKTLIDLREDIKKEFNISVSFVVSEKCKRYRDYTKSYNRVARAVVINKNQREIQDVIFIDDYRIQLFINSVSNENRDMYLDNYESFFNQSNNKLMQELVQTVKIYFENNMNIGKSAIDLYIHRNTVGYRLKKIKENFGIDITKPYECMKLYIAICLYQQPKQDLKM